MTNDAKLIDAIKRAFNFPSDVAVAGFLGVEKQTVYLARKGECPLGERLRFKIIDKVYQNRIDNLAMRCSPENLLLKILENHRNQGVDNALGPIEHGHHLPADSHLIDIYKAYSAFKTDRELAERLSVKRSSISVIRSGRGRMGTFMRLKIFSDVWQVDISEVEEAMISPDALLKMVKAYPDLRPSAPAIILPLERSE